MKKITKQNIHVIITIVIGTIIPFFVFLTVYDMLKNGIVDFNVFDMSKIIGFIILTTVSYYGILNLLKPFLESFNSWTQNKSILKFLTILITALSVMSLIRMWEYYDIPLNYNDRGIVLEMIGFFIYLNPISRYLTNFITSKNEDVDHKLMIQTTAIVLVLFGLILQFSYFT